MPVRRERKRRPASPPPKPPKVCGLCNFQNVHVHAPGWNGCQCTEIGHTTVRPPAA